MKPAPFDYFRAPDIAQAVAALAAAEGEARLLAGGQTLGPMLNLRVATPPRLVDIGRIGALKTIERRGDVLVIGAGVTHARLEDHDDPSPLGRFLAVVAGGIAFRAIRNRGTIGGSLAHSDPAADWVTAMTVLDARLVVAGPQGQRSVKMRSFMRAALTNVLGPAELIAAIEIDILGADARWGYYKLCRKFGEFPEAIGAVLLDPGRGLCRMVAGALEGPPVSLDGLAAEVVREGIAGVTLDRIVKALGAAEPGLDAVDLQLHAVALRRALSQAAPP
jgi:carbon-monoxide dehydrogenase medium subunit